MGGNADIDEVPTNTSLDYSNRERLSLDEVTQQTFNKKVAVEIQMLGSAGDGVAQQVTELMMTV